MSASPPIDAPPHAQADGPGPPLADARSHAADPPPAAGKPSAAEAPPRNRTWKPAANSLAAVLIFSAVIICGVLLVLAAFSLPPFKTPVQRTEDAYVYGHTTVISPEVSGYVWQVRVDDFAQVKGGEVLVVIDPRTYAQSVEQAKATVDQRRTDLANNAQTLQKSLADVKSADAAVASAEAQLVHAQSDLKRSQDLVRDGSISQRENDQNVATVRQAEAGVKQAGANRDTAVEQVRSVQVNTGALKAQVGAALAQQHSAELQLERTAIHAPQDGQISEVGVHVGQYVTEGTQLFFLVPPERWVTANYKEDQTRHMAPGQRAWFTVDALGSARIWGRVARLSPATGSQFAVLKPDNATGNFTKVPQRISVRILVDDHQPLASRLKPGMSVEASVDTTGGPVAR